MSVRYEPTSFWLNPLMIRDGRGTGRMADITRGTVYRQVLIIWNTVPFKKILENHELRALNLFIKSEKRV